MTLLQEVQKQSVRHDAENVKYLGAVMLIALALGSPPCILGPRVGLAFVL